MTDVWASWLLGRRSGGDPEAARQVREGLRPVRERVLDGAGLEAGSRLLDVGCGDGLIAFGALERGVAQVIFSDVSGELLDVCRRQAAELDVLGRCRFVRAPADGLEAVADGSVDAVTTRSVLIYVADKRRAFEEFWRVLAPGGRMSVFEPINRYFLDADGRHPPSINVAPIADLVARVDAEFRQPELGPMLDFGERDLLTLAEQVGFGEVHLRLEVDIRPRPPRRWEAFYRSSPNPFAPTLEEALRRALAPAEIERYIEHVRPIVESGAATVRAAVAYLTAVKPAAA